MYKNMQDKIKHSAEIIKKAVKNYRRIAVACSFGKDSMATVLLAREVNPDIPVFSILTVFKPQATFEYLTKMNKLLNLNVTVYMVARDVPPILKDAGIAVKLLPADRFEAESAEVEMVYGKKIYEAAPDRCCELLKVEPAKEAVKNYDAWVCGLRNTEGRTRKDYKEIEVLVETVEGKTIETTTNLDEIPFARLSSTRNAFRNYNAFEPLEPPTKSF